ncbi:MAG: hypothetical protein KIC77_03775 [Clostridiales bacterium]|jgi:hypothetical protein|nr:hypothetical protein [Clostridiales bacterium]
MKKLWIWIAALAVGILTLLFRMEISQYMADLTALLIVGTVLSVFGAAGILLEPYIRRNK